MKDFDLKKYLVENKLTANSRLLSENETETKMKDDYPEKYGWPSLETIKKKFNAADDVFFRWTEYLKTANEKYAQNANTVQASNEFARWLNSQREKDVLSNLHRFDVTDTEPMEIFMKYYYSKYKKFEGGENVTEDNKGEALEVLRVVDKIILKFIGKRIHTDYSYYGEKSSYRVVLEKAAEEAKRAVEDYKKIKA